MGQTLANVGGARDGWKLRFGVGILGIIFISLLTPFGFWGSFFGLVGLVFLLWGVRSLVRAFSSRSVERVNIGAIAGESVAVQLVGDARPVDSPVTAPLTGADCVAYRVEVVEYRPSSDGGH